MKIGFIGLGNMGNPMARNLIKAGHPLTVYDLSAAAVEKLVASGAKAVSTIAEVASVNELILTMLPSSPQVRDVYLGAGQLLANVKPGVMLVDCSTIDPLTAREVAVAAQQRGNIMLDAPVSGGTVGAEAATLTFMVGGETAGFETAKPILASMGKNIVHCGASGNGQAVKICNNMLLASSMIAVSEAMNLGAALGIDPTLLANIINTSSGRCWSSDTYNPYPGVLESAPASRNYSGGFCVDFMLKDMGLALDAAAHAKQPVMLAGLAKQLYQTWSAQGGGNKDFSSIIQLYQHNKSIT
ncbi:MAG: 3-hydroxyisobutyrate dehydrogenase [Burkholderiales bacterium]